MGISAHGQRGFDESNRRAHRSRKTVEFRGDGFRAGGNFTFHDRERIFNRENGVGFRAVRRFHPSFVDVIQFDRKLLHGLLQSIGRCFQFSINRHHPLLGGQHRFDLSRQAVDLFSQVFGRFTLRQRAKFVFRIGQQC